MGRPRAQPSSVLGACLLTFPIPIIIVWFHS